MPKIAMFFDTKAERDEVYAAILPTLSGDDHGVGGGELLTDGSTAQWQLWASDAGLDLAAIDAAASGKTGTRAADGKIDTTFSKAGAK